MSRLVRIAWQVVSRRPLRSLLTAVSLILGVLALTSVAAAQDVMRQTITHTALLAGGPTVTSSVAVTDKIDPLAVASRWQHSLAFRDGPHTATARVLRPGGLTLTADGVPLADVAVTLVDPSLVDVRPFDQVSGAWLGQAPALLAPALVLNVASAEQHPATAAWTLGWGASGQTVTVTAIGVVDDGDPSPTAYLDLTGDGPWRRAAIAGGALTIEVHAPGVDDATLRTQLQQTQAIAGLRGQTGDVRRTDTLHQLSNELGTTSRVFVAVAVVALTIAAVGMLNIGLSTLAERSEELSLRRAFGAHRRDVFTLMLLESQMVAIVAGLLAIAIAYAAMPLTLSAFGATGTTAHFPLVAALLGFGAGILAALAGSLVPAVTAVRTPIAGIMRG